MKWTVDELSTPESRQIVEEISTSVHCFRLVRDRRPDRWYVVRIVIDGQGIVPNGRTSRTPVYPSRNSPALQRTWGDITAMKGALRPLEPSQERLKTPGKRNAP